jgi:hypothetical protein
MFISKVATRAGVNIRRVTMCTLELSGLLSWGSDSVRPPTKPILSTRIAFHDKVAQSKISANVPIST